MSSPVLPRECDSPETIESNVHEEARILLLEDSPSDTEAIILELRSANLQFVLHRVESRAGCENELKNFHPSIVLSEYVLPGWNALDALRLVKETAADTPFVLVAAELSDPAADACIAAGADDYVRKSDLHRLGLAVRSALAQRALRMALAQSNDQYNNLVEHTHDFIQRTSTDGRFLFVNPAWCDVLGYTDEELQHMTLRDVLHPDCQPRCEQLFDQAARGRHVANLEAVFVGKDGACVYVEGSASPTVVKGNVIGASSFFRDVTERKKAEDHLRKSTEQLSLALESSNTGLWDWDLQRDDVYYSPEWKRQLGYEDTELFGKFRTWEDLLHPEDREQVLGRLQSHLKDPHGSFESEFRLRHRDGSYRWIYSRAKVFRDNAGMPVRMLGSHVDVTDRRKVLDEVEEARRRVVNILESVSDAFVSLDVNWRYTYVNRRAGEILNRRPAELIGKHIWTEFPEGVGQPFHKAYEQAMKEQRIVELEEYYPPYDRWFENRIYPGIDGLSIFFHDITSRKKAEILLAGEHHTMEKIATAASLTESLESITQNIERQSPGVLCSILLVDEDGKRLRSAAGPSLPAAYSETIDGVQIGPAAGSCGTAAFRGEPVIVSDISTDPLWADYKELALQHNLKACWSTPIVATDKRTVLGTFAMYYREPRTPGPAEIALIERATNQARIAIERKNAEESLQRSEAKYRKLVEGTHALLFSTDVKGRITYLNESAAKALGATADQLVGRFYLQFVHPDDRARVHGVFRDQLSSAQPERYAEFRYRGDNGTEGWFNFLVNPLFQGGQIVGLSGVAQEISERKRVEEALRRSREMFTKAFRSSPDAILISTLATGRFVEVNEGFTRLSGFTHEEVLGRTALELGLAPHPDQRTKYADAIREHGRVIDLEIQYYTKSGELRDALVSGERITIEHEECILTVVHDVTERKRAEEAIRSYEKRFSLAFNANPVLSTISTIEHGRFIAANDSFLKTAGYSADEVIGRTALELGLWPNPEERRVIMEKLRKAGTLRDVEVHLHQKSGSIRTLLLSIETIEIEGKPCYLHVASDITERKHAEEALRRSEAQYRRIVETASEGIWTIDQENMISYVNARMASMLGYAVEEMIGKSIFHFMEPAGEEIARQKIQRRREGISEQYDFKFKRKDGTDVWTLLATNPILDDQGQYLGALAMVTDITERKSLEGKLERTNEELRALAGHLQSVREDERIRIAREIHDELGQVLTAVKMDLTMLSRRLGKKNETTGLQKIQQEVSEDINLVDRTIKSIRKIASELRPEVLDAAGLIPALEGHISEFQSRSGIRCSFEPEMEELNLDIATSTGLYRIVQESLTNVARHSGASEIRVQLRQIDGEILLTVSDNGRGFSEDEISSKKSLGIVGMRERAILLGGEFTISSTAGKGTTLIIRIPITGQHDAK